MPHYRTHKAVVLFQQKRTQNQTSLNTLGVSSQYVIKQCLSIFSKSDWQIQINVMGRQEFSDSTLSLPQFRGVKIDQNSGLESKVMRTGPSHCVLKELVGLRRLLLQSCLTYAELPVLLLNKKIVST